VVPAVTIQFQEIKLSSRIFLYSAFFFVSILLYDSYQRTFYDVEPQVSQTMPETKKNVEKKASVENNVNSDVENKTLDVSSEVINVRTDFLDVDISLIDGSIVKSRLLQYKRNFNNEDKKVILLNERESGYVAKADVQTPDTKSPNSYKSSQDAYYVESYPYTVTLNGNNSEGVRFEKKYVFNESSHLINVSNTIYNEKADSIQARFYTILQRGEDTDSNVMLYTYTGAAFYDEENKFNKISFSDITDNNFKLQTYSSWISMLQHYFFTAWISEKESDQTIFTRRVLSEDIPYYQIGSLSNYEIISPNSSKTFSSNLYVGPKNVSEISNITEGLDLTVDYGVLTFLAAPLFWVLDKLNMMFDNWGIALIMLTILIKLLFFKLSETSYKSMAKMKKLAPRMTALKERYADDRKKFSEELMKVYKQEKVNPLGGCLPILVQIPVFIALYWVIVESVEMRHAPFVGWIVDLSSKDPLFVLPILMGLSMYIQQKLNPPPTDAMQQKIFLALPFIFTILFATFPSGLVLYWLVNNILSIGQQYVINRRLSV